MSVVPLRQLLQRRLVIVTGKGGTGKTTVAACLAVAANEQGKRVAVVEVGRDEHLHHLIAPGSKPVGYAGRELRPGLWVAHIDPFEALAEYLRLQVGFGPIVNRTVKNQAFHQLLSGTPGWRELVILGKVWYIERGSAESKRPAYDLVIVDAPASGHGLTFLDVPRVAQSAVRAGPLRRDAARVESLLLDPERTLLLPVSLAEELPARETVELVDRVRSDVGTPLDRVVVNSVTDAPFPLGVEDLAGRLAALPPDTPTGRLPGVDVLADCVATQTARHTLNRGFVEEIAERTRLPVVPLPYLSSGISNPEDLIRLSQSLLAEPLTSLGPAGRSAEISS
jgi:anion-transporting  ArsA/GET3 family ATPase